MEASLAGLRGARHSNFALQAGIKGTDANGELGLAMLPARGISVTVYVSSEEAS